MQTQLTTLQTALTTAQNDATAAKSAAATAQTTADQALTLAKAAATQTEVDQIQTAITNLKTLLANKVDKSVYDTEVTKLEGEIEAINSDLNVLKTGTISAAVAKYAVIKDIESQITALQTFKTSIEGLNLPTVIQTVNNTASELNTLKGTVQTNSDNITDLRTRMESAEAAIAKMATTSQIAGLQSQIDALNVLISKMLTSLVFQPSFYYGGVEAMEATTISYNAITLNNDSPVAAPLATGETVTNAATASSLSPAVVANYHMNPSYIDWKKIDTLTFISADKDYFTKAAGLNPKAISWTGVDGVLKVKLNLDATKIETGANKITVLALQAHYKNAADTTVTSDYAAIKQSTITGITIADAKASLNPWATCVANQHFHIYATAADAINNAFTHTLVYNDQTGVDMNDLVEMHFTRDAAAETSTTSVADYGMKWEFAPSNYKAGTNSTSESVHIYMKGSKVIATMPAADGKSALDPVGTGVQNKAEIDRLPMVRVVLRDTVNDKIVKVGFIKFKIVDQAAATTNPDPKVITFTNANGIDLSCTGYEKKLTWAEIENQVLASLNNGTGMSKANFEANYTLQGPNANLTLYSYDATTKVGTVTTKTPNVSNIVDPNNHETNVLDWIVSNTDVYNAVWDATTGTYKTGKSLSATILFKSNNPGVNPDIYVTFNTGEIKIPSATWGNTNKLSNYWAAKDASLGSGYAEIHNNVEVVGQTNANDEFDVDILNTIVKNKVALQTITGSTDFAAANLTFKFSFAPYTKMTHPTLVGQSGTTYYMYTANNGTELWATTLAARTGGEKVAIISSARGNITSAQTIQSVVSWLDKAQYATYSYAADILNAVSHKNVANTATATLVLDAQNGCNYMLPITDPYFDVKFLRPLNAEGAQNKVFTDAVTGGNILDLVTLVDFTDWRDQWATTPDFYGYYGIKDITPDIAGVTTDLDGGTLGTTKLSDKTSLMKLTKTATGATALPAGRDYGTLKYENNGSVVSNFKVRVPLTITYDWGKLTKSYVDITVNYTTVNPAKKN